MTLRVIEEPRRLPPRMKDLAMAELWRQLDASWPRLVKLVRWRRGRLFHDTGDYRIVILVEPTFFGLFHLGKVRVEWIDQDSEVVYTFERHHNLDGFGCVSCGPAPDAWEKLWETIHVLGYNGFERVP